MLGSLGEWRQEFGKNVQSSDEEFVLKTIHFSFRGTALTCYTSVLPVENILEIPPNLSPRTVKSPTSRCISWYEIIFFSAFLKFGQRKSQAEANVLDTVGWGLLWVTPYCVCSLRIASVLFNENEVCCHKSLV